MKYSVTASCVRLAPSKQVTQAKRQRGRSYTSLQKKERAERVDKAKRCVLDLATKARAVGATTSCREYADLLSAVEGLQLYTDNEERKDVAYGQTIWELVYSSSEGPSSGRIGPFDAMVEQRFDEASQLAVSTSKLGPLTASLGMRYKRDSENENRVDVTLSTTSVSLFGGLMEYSTSAHEGRRGFWDEIYTDRDLRVVHGSHDSLFVMKRVDFAYR